jgi:hypothetical protein
LSFSREGVFCEVVAVLEDLKLPGINCDHAAGEEGGGVELGVLCPFQKGPPVLDVDLRRIPLI